MAQTSTLIAQQQVLFAGYRLTVQMNKIAEAFATDALDATTLGSTTRYFEPGLKRAGYVFDGLYAAADVDANLFTNHRVANVPMTLALTDGSVSSPARSLKSMIANHKVIEGSVGGLATMSVELVTTAKQVNGSILFNSEVSGNTNGTAVQLGAVSATQSLYAALHVFSGTGSFIVKVQSDDNSGFTTATDRITFATVATGTPSASEWATPVAGAITDDWWRVVCTNPNTRDFAVFVGIQTTAG